MIEYIEGNIFNSPAQVIVNTVNTVGVMGKGLALSFKKRYPQMFEAYKRACDKHQLTIGKLMLYYAPDHWILMFPTKENWRNPSKLEYLEAGLHKFVNTYAEKGVTSIAFPKLGCGNGELSWSDVKPVMERYLKQLPITVYIYVGMDATQTPEHRAQEETLEWLRKNARDMSFTGLCDDLQHSTAILPIQFTVDGVNYSATWENSIVFTKNTQHVGTISKDDLFCLWDQLRVNGIVSSDEISELHSLFYHLLNHMGYLSPVRILNQQGEFVQNGYQVHEGYGRVYELRSDPV
ncbi:MAG: macro domain-containing protein [Lachnospiraceae bacterium]